MPNKPKNPDDIDREQSAARLTQDYMQAMNDLRLSVIGIVFNPDDGFITRLTSAPVTAEEQMRLTIYMSQIIRQAEELNDLATPPFVLGQSDSSQTAKRAQIGSNTREQALKMADLLAQSVLQVPDGIILNELVEMAKLYIAARGNN